MLKPDDQLTPEQLDRAAESFERQAALLRELARLRRGETGEAPLLNVQRRRKVGDGMTESQLMKRGAAIAAAAAETGDELQRAVVKSRWKSLARYARDRLQISPGSLTGYRLKKRACPRRVADLVLKDLGVPHTYWLAVE